MGPSGLELGEFEVRNRHGDVVQRGEMITIETPEGIEGFSSEPITLRSGDQLSFSQTFSFDG